MKLSYSRGQAVIVYGGRCHLRHSRDVTSPKQPNVAPRGNNAGGSIWDSVSGRDRHIARATSRSGRMRAKSARNRARKSWLYCVNAAIGFLRLTGAINITETVRRNAYQVRTLFAKLDIFN
jgi:hypothetical protein